MDNKQQKWVCKLCGYEAKNITALTTHLQYKHPEYNTQRYYDEFYKKPNEGICEVCGKQTRFINMVRGYFKYCCKSCSHKNEHFRQVYTDSISKKTAKEKEEWHKAAQNKIRNQSSTGRCITDEVALKRKQQSIKHLKEIVEKCDCTFIDYEMDKDNIKVSRVTFKCNKCGTVYTRLRACIDRRERNKTYNNLCQMCSPKNLSKPEKEFAEYVASIYNGNILRNDRNYLSGNELDIILPDLKIAFEFDGIFWHMDSRFYKPNDVNPKTLRTAQDIWNFDADKIKRCANIGLTLYRIKEYDWITDQELIKENVKKLLK